MNEIQPAEADPTRNLQDIPAHLLPVQDFATPSTESGIGVPPAPTARPKMLPQPIEFSAPPSKRRPAVSVDGTVDVTYYKGQLGSFRVIFPWGAAANFVKHVYATTDQREIDYLDEEAENIKLLKATGIMDVEELTDPMLAFKNKIIREFLAEQAAQRLRANNPTNDAGDSDQKFRMNSANTSHAIDPAAMMAAAQQAASPEGGGAQTFAPGNIRQHLADLQARAGKK